MEGLLGGVWRCRRIDFLSDCPLVTGDATLLTYYSYGIPANIGSGIDRTQLLASPVGLPVAALFPCPS